MIEMMMTIMIIEMMIEKMIIMMMIMHLSTDTELIIQYLPLP